MTDFSSCAAPRAVSELATLLQLGRRARDAAGPEVLGFVAVNESRQLLHYRQAALGRAHALAGWLPGQVLAVSGLPQPDPQAPYVQWLAGLFTHLEGAADPAGPAAPRCLDGAALPPALARDWAAWLPRHALLLPLIGPDGGSQGQLLLARAQPWDQHEMMLGAELAHVYAHALARFTPADNWRRRLRLWLAPGARRWKLGLGLLLVTLLPVRMSVLAPAEVAPLEPFTVRAPLDGVVDQFHVSPNQPVLAGQALFDLDTTALRARFGVARKALDVAAEEYRQAAQGAVNDERSKAELPLKKGKLDERTLELDYSRQLLERIQVKAPRAGVAVFADASEWQGRALSAGERVLTLADPAKVELSLSLAVADAVELAPGAQVTLYPNGSLFTSYEATLSSAAYRAEPTADGVLAYRLKARFAPGATPRLGLMGVAKVRGAWAPLAYYALRRPLTAARQWLGW